MEEQKEAAAKKAADAEKAKNTHHIPKYHYHTTTSVQKVKNGPNKSLAKRIKKNHGLIEVIANDNVISKEKMKDIRKIAQNIDRVYTIET